MTASSINLAFKHPQMPCMRALIQTDYNCTPLKKLKKTICFFLAPWPRWMVYQPDPKPKCSNLPATSPYCVLAAKSWELPHVFFSLFKLVTGHASLLENYWKLETTSAKNIVVFDGFWCLVDAHDIFCMIDWWEVLLSHSEMVKWVDFNQLMTAWWFGCHVFSH